LIAVAAALLVGCTPGSDSPAVGTDGSLDSAPVIAAGEPSISATIDNVTATSSTAAPGTTSGSAGSVTKDVATRSVDAVGDGIVPEGFTTVVATVTSGDGDACTICLWLADSADERSRGLMGVTDLAGPVGMAFVWDEPTESRFFMFETPTPLSIAWFGADGSHVGQADMAPCLATDSSQCDRYTASAPFVIAIEMLQGELAAIGIGPGSTVELRAGSESPDCALSG
jgi:uncharacterized membrane protein (UPF0127 family)